MKWWKVKRGMMPTTTHRWNHFLHYIPWLGHSLRSRVQFLLCKIDCCMNVIDRNKEAVSYRKFEYTICWRQLTVGRGRSLQRHHLLKIINKKKGRELQEIWRYYLQRRLCRRDSHQGGRCEYSKLCPNCARGSKSSDIGKEVTFKTLSLLNTLPKPKEISPITEYCWGNRITKAELEVEGFMFST